MRNKGNENEYSFVLKYQNNHIININNVSLTIPKILFKYIKIKKKLYIKKFFFLFY